MHRDGCAAMMALPELVRALARANERSTLRAKNGEKLVGRHGSAVTIIVKLSLTFSRSTPPPMLRSLHKRSSTRDVLAP